MGNANSCIYTEHIVGDSQEYRLVGGDVIIKKKMGIEISESKPREKTSMCQKSRSHSAL